jgi:hypothetical protein
VTTIYDAPHDELDDGPYWTFKRVVLGALVILSVGFWAWIFLFAPRDNPDRLTTRSFAVSAEAICSPAQVAINALPPGNTATTAQERARQIEVGTAITSDMVDALKAAAAGITDVDDNRIIDLWFEDWDAYIDDRQAYVAKLDAATEDTPNRELVFTLQARASGGVYTRRIDGFGNANDMVSCNVPGDI